MVDRADAIISLVRPIADSVAHLPLESRITLLMGLLAQEVCNFPLSERRREMLGIIADFPSVVSATEAGMRDALVCNAQSG